MLIATAVLAVLAAVFGYAATRPGTFRVERSALIQAPPERVYPLIEDFHRWEVWSPWDKLDPTMKKTFQGPERGTGSIYGWEGNGKAGAGRMEILESSPPSRVAIQLDFIRPFRVRNTTEFTLEPRGDATSVTWAMHGPSPYLSKVMGLFVSMDRMVGKDFEAGLANMKAAAEK